MRTTDTLAPEIDKDTDRHLRHRLQPGDNGEDH
jgi:hypothetical protein